MEAVALVAGPVATVATALAWLFWPRRRSPAEQERLERATRRVERELAGNVELVGMFLQTKQPAVLELSGYREARGEIAGADAELASRLDVLYERIPDAESAMERRGPAGSLKPEDRETVHAWQGDARELQRAVRDLGERRPTSPGVRLLTSLRKRFGV